MKTNKFVIFTDGSAINNSANSPAGSSVLIPNVINGYFLVSKSQYGSNNIAELDAIRYALRIVNQNLEMFRPNIINNEVWIYSDSKYAIGVVTGNMKSKANIELINKCKYYLNILIEKGISVNFNHVLAHTSKHDYLSICNAIVDRCANAAAQELNKTKKPKQWTKCLLTDSESRYLA